MYGAHEVDRQSAPELFGLVAELAGRAGLPMPRVFVMDEAQPNAFATGRNAENAVVCCTAGILELVNKDELEGVLAHELAHIRDRDVLIQSTVSVLACAIVETSRIGGFLQRGLLFVLGPFAAALVNLFLSPKRELLADAAAAELCNSPHGLADALIRLEQTGELVEFQASPATEPLYTINPFAEEGLAALFVTHPPVGERVAKLRARDPGWREKLRAA
jgi:heat shock protein HtpX